MPRALRRERRRKEHARKDPRRHPCARWRRSCWSGTPVRFDSPRDALAAGVGMVHQELAFCENLTVAENLCLGALPPPGCSSPREFAPRAEMLAAIGARSTSPSRRRADDRAAADAADRGRRRHRCAGRGVRRAHEQPVAAEAERLYALIGQLRARGVTCCTCPSHGRDLPPVRHGDGPARRPPRGDAGRRRARRRLRSSR